MLLKTLVNNFMTKLFFMHFETLFKYVHLVTSQYKCLFVQIIKKNFHRWSKCIKFALRFCKSNIEFFFKLFNLKSRCNNLKKKECLCHELHFQMNNQHPIIMPSFLFRKTLLYLLWLVRLKAFSKNYCVRRVESKINFETNFTLNFLATLKLVQLYTIISKN